jgi:hypothetical protein
MDSVQKAQFLLLFYWDHYAYILRGFPVIASDTQIVWKESASNTSENSLSDVIVLIYNKFCALLHIAFLNASCFETNVLERWGTNMSDVRCMRKLKASTLVHFLMLSYSHVICPAWERRSLFSIPAAAEFLCRVLLPRRWMPCLPLFSDGPRVVQGRRGGPAIHWRRKILVGILQRAGWSFSADCDTRHPGAGPRRGPSGFQGFRYS